MFWRHWFVVRSGAQCDLYGVPFLCAARAHYASVKRVVRWESPANDVCTMPTISVTCAVRAMRSINRQGPLGVWVRVAESAGVWWELVYALASGIHHGMLWLAKSGTAQSSPTHTVGAGICTDTCNERRTSTRGGSRHMK